MGYEIEATVGVGYWGLNIYSSHTFEAVRSFVERRRGGWVGVRPVQYVPTEKLVETMERGRVRHDLLEAALRKVRVLA
jgi:hypothetical protein